MNNIYINASIEITNKRLYKVLTSIEELNNSKLELKLKDFGYEIGYKDQYIYIYVYGNERENDNETIIFDCKYQKPITEAHKFVHAIIKKLKDYDIKYYNFEYGLGDKEGNEIGEQFEIKS